MKKTFFVAATALFLTAVGASAQALATFTAENIPNTTGTTVATSTAGQSLTVGPYAAEVNNLANSGTANLTGFHSGTTFATSVTTFSTPAGQTPTATKSLSSNNWSVGDYYQFALSNTLTTIPQGSFGVTFGVLGSGTGPSTFNFQYSLDNTTYTTLGTYNVTTAFVTQSFLLGSVAGLYNSTTPVYFRLTDAATSSITAGGTVAAGGTSRFDNFTVGNAAVPEPATYAYVLGGLGALALGVRRRRMA